MTTLANVSKILLAAALSGAMLGACHKTPADTSANNAAMPTPAPPSPAPPAGAAPDGTAATTTTPTSPDPGNTATAPAPAPKY